MNSGSDRQGVAVEFPGEGEIARAASELNLLLIEHCDRLGKELLDDRFKFSGDGSRSSERRRKLQLELTKLRIRRAANVDLGGAVTTARIAGATWEQVGKAVGTSRQAAFERWGKAVKAFEDARRQAGRMSEDVLDRFDPAGRVADFVIEPK
ncbi:hypothetical protein ACFWU5_10815 [Nocardia sp. NPDC058640]|uniref:hypothetical protein n=1 Tax=Nocardia sp. NPDC058640 TaxID=3346571 RepID=UPI00365761F8